MSGFSAALAGCDTERNRLVPPSGMLCTGASGMPSDRIPVIDRFVSAEMSRQKIPGMALAVVKNGEVVAARGYGFANLERRIPRTAQNICRAVSIGKQFTRDALDKPEAHG